MVQPYYIDKSDFMFANRLSVKHVIKASFINNTKSCIYLLIFSRRIVELIPSV